MKTSTQNAHASSLSHELKYNIFGLSLVFVTPMLGGFLYGFDIGATSFVLSMLLQASTHQYTEVNSDEDLVWWHQFSSVQQGLFVSALSLGALVGSHLVLMYFSQTIGRRMELRICATLYILGTFLNVLSGTWLRFSVPEVGFMALFLGRILFGMGVGFIMHGAPAYLAEMCPAEIRGAVVSAKETVIVAGIVVGYATGNVFSSNPTNWSDLYGISIVLAVPMLFLTYCIPRSKRWLLMKDHREEAYESMQYVYKGDITLAFDELVTSVAGNQTKFPKKHHESYRDTKGETPEASEKYEPSLLSRDYRSAMIASMGLIVFQQFSGQPSVLSYATILFEAAGWSGNASVVCSILMMFTSMTTVALVDRVGRKKLLLAGCLIMMAALSALSTTFWGWEDSARIRFNHTQQIIVLVAMFVYIGGYQVGFGPITWCIVSEVFPLEIRGKAIALGVELNYALNFLVQFSFPVIQNRLGWGPSFFLFGAILAFCFFFVKVFVPETTGLTLEEIQEKLAVSRGVHYDTTEEDASSERVHFFPTERTSLLNPQAPVLGAVANLEEMESQMIRTHSSALISQRLLEQHVHNS